jgi:ABC-2 type transport system ATP-binding protein
MMQPRSAIRATGLRKSFGDHVVLDGIDLDVAEGTALALVGYVWARWAFDRERTR